MVALRNTSPVAEVFGSAAGASGGRKPEATRASAAMSVKGRTKQRIANLQWERCATAYQHKAASGFAITLYFGTMMPPSNSILHLGNFVASFSAPTLVIFVLIECRNTSDGQPLRASKPAFVTGTS